MNVRPIELLSVFPFRYTALIYVKFDIVILKFMRQYIVVNFL